VSLLGSLIQKAQQRASQVYDQVNPLDNGLSYQKRQINPNVQPQSVARQAVRVVQPVANMTGVPAAIDAARLATAEATHNQAAAGAATQRLATNLPQFLPIAIAESVKPFAQSVATTVLSPYANHVANQQADYARRTLNGNSGNPAHDAAVEAYANSIKQDFYRQQLAQNGINPNDSNGTITRKVAGQAGSAAANIAMAGAAPGALATRAAPALARNAAFYGGASAAAGAAQTAQMDDPTIRDYLKNTAEGAAMGAAVPALGYAAHVALPAAARGARAANAQVGEGGFLAGSEAKGFKQAKAKGQVFDGVEGKPRFEVDDSKAKFNNFTHFINDTSKTHKLSDVLDHPQLYRQYPELKDTKLVINKGAFTDGTNAEYSPTTKTIRLNTGGLISPRPDGKPVDLATIQARAKATILHEVQHGIQERESFARGGRPNAPDANQVAAIQQQIKENTAGLARTKDSLTRHKITNHLFTLQDQLTSLRQDELNNYRNLAGEAESRAVAARADMPMSERYQKGKSTFDNSLDVPKNELIVNESGGDAMSAPAKTKVEDLAKMSVDEREAWFDSISHQTPRDENLISDSLDKLRRAAKYKMSKIRQGDEKYYDYDTDKVARERFNIPLMEKISSGGSDRDVYDMGDGHVLKVAKTARGLAQNQAENDYYAAEQGLIPKVKETGLNYVVSEKVNPPDAATRKMVKEMNSRFSQRDFDNHTPEVQDFLEKHGLEEIGNFDIMAGDYTSIRNWGTTAKGKPIHLDGGTLNKSILDDPRYRATPNFETMTMNKPKNLDDAEFRQVYERSRAAKKKYGDTDKATMYSIGEPTKNLTSSLDAQKYATFDSFYKDYKPFFDGQGIKSEQAQTIYNDAQHAPVAISKSGTARTAAELTVPNRSRPQRR
jgi:hypothetical protein